MTVVADWLDRRRPGMPGDLRLAVDAALAGAGDGHGGGGTAGTPGTNGRADMAGEGDVADVLAGAALAALARVAGASSDRSTAAELLAADALLTYACEAAAEVGPERLEHLTARLDPARFAALLEAPTP